MLTKKQEVTNACNQLLKDEQTLSITFDNGKEFALHESIADKLGADIYFARLIILGSVVRMKIPMV